jgi:hypothetical protein
METPKNLIQTAGGMARVVKDTGINPRTIGRIMSGTLECPPELLDLLQSLSALRGGPPFAERLRTEREAARMTQAQAARAISPILTARIYAAWEAGEDEPPAWSQPIILASIIHAFTPPR